jgi:hypothetical protein
MIRHSKKLYLCSPGSAAVAAHSARSDAGVKASVPHTAGISAAHHHALNSCCCRYGYQIRAVCCYSIALRVSDAGKNQAKSRCRRRLWK